MSRRVRSCVRIACLLASLVCGGADAQVYDERLRELVEPDSTAAPDSLDASAPAIADRDSTRAARADTLAAAGADSAAAGLPTGFAPRAAGEGAFLRSRPEPSTDTLAPITPFDEVLLPPEGPALVLDRADLRLLGHVELADVAHLVPGLFALRSGYPGVTTPFSFRARGPDGTLLLYDGRPLAGGYTPVENPHVVSRGHLSGAAVMRVGASHIYGPGAGAGAIQLMPLATAPDRAFSEASTMTGIFGQRSGSFTTSFRWYGVGVLFEYDGAAANPWSLFGGYNTERANGRLDWRSGGTTITATAGLHDERLRYFVPLRKRTDEGRESSVMLQHRTDGWVGALRGVRHTSRIRADGQLGFEWQDLERWRGEGVFRRRVGEHGWVGLLAGAVRDRRERRDVAGRIVSRIETGGHALVRARLGAPSLALDVSGRWDHLTTGEDAIAAGATLSHAYRGGVLWLHVARTVDRPAFFHRDTDAYTQIDQGIDRPWPGGVPLPTGLTGAAGLRVRLGRLTTELGASVDRTERVWAQVPEPHDGPLAIDEPDRWITEEVESVGGWASLELGPVWLGKILGSFAVGGSAFVSSTPELRRLQVEPYRYGDVWGRLRKDLFSGAMRVEAELDWEILGEMPTFFGDLEPQQQVTARLGIQIKDVIVYYRSENVFGSEFVSSAYDESIGYAPITNQNVTVGASWVLLD